MMYRCSVACFLWILWISAATSVHSVEALTYVQAAELTVVFEPGAVGITADWMSGLVQYIAEDGQAHRLGVRAGMRFLTVEGEPYTEDRFVAATAGAKSYEATFAQVSACNAKFNETTKLIGGAASCLQPAWFEGLGYTFPDGLGGSCTSNCRVLDGPQTASACYHAIKLASGCATHFSYSSSQARCWAKTAVGSSNQLLMQKSYGYTSGSIECAATNVTANVAAPVAAGATEIQIDSTIGFAVGDTVRIHDADNSELNEISGFGSVLLRTPLQHSYAAGASFVNIYQATGLEQITESSASGLTENSPSADGVLRLLIVCGVVVMVAIIICVCTLVAPNYVRKIFQQASLPVADPSGTLTVVAPPGTGTDRFPDIAPKRGMVHVEKGDAKGTLDLLRKGKEEQMQAAPGAKEGVQKSAVYTEGNTSALFADLNELDIAQQCLTEHWMIPPEQLEKKQEVAKGGFGAVFAGTYLKSVAVALKTSYIKKEELDCQQADIALAHEIRLFRRIRHPNVVFFHGMTLLGNPPSLCLVLEWCAGGDMSNYVRKRHADGSFEKDCRLCSAKTDPGVPVQLAMVPEQGILEDVARGMLYLHIQDPPILHRDLKPNNILLDASVPPKAKIADFGLSLLVKGVGAQGMAGTRGYMAPEVMHGSVYDCPADVYSFGCCCYFALVCKGPAPMQAQRLLQEAAETDQIIGQFFPPPIVEVGLQCVRDCAEDRISFELAYSLFSDTPEDSTHLSSNSVLDESPLLSTQSKSTPKDSSSGPGQTPVLPQTSQDDTFAMLHGSRLTKLQPILDEQGEQSILEIASSIGVTFDTPIPKTYSADAYVVHHGAAEADCSTFGNRDLVIDVACATEWSTEDTTKNGLRITL